MADYQWTAHLLITRDELTTENRPVCARESAWKPALPFAACYVLLVTCCLLRAFYLLYVPATSPFIARPSGPGSRRLSAQSELRDDGPVAFDVLSLQIAEKPPAPPHHAEKPSPRVVIFGVGLEMLGELGDTRREQGYLHFRGASVACGPSVFRDDLVLLFVEQTHARVQFPSKKLVTPAGNTPSRQTSC